MILLFNLILFISMYSHAEGPPSGRFESLSFNKDQVGITFREMKYIGDTGILRLYQLDPQTWTATPIDERKYSELFAGGQKHSAADLTIEFGAKPKKIKLSDGKDLTINYSGCKHVEWTTSCEKTLFKIGEFSFELNPPSASRTEFLTAFKWDDQLWLGQATLGEMSSYGQGLRVEDLKSKKKVFATDEKDEDGRQLISIMALGPRKDQMWILGNKGITTYDKQFKVLHRCKLETPLDQQGQFKFFCEK